MWGCLVIFMNAWGNYKVPKSNEKLTWYPSQNRSHLQTLLHKAHSNSVKEEMMAGKKTLATIWIFHAIAKGNKQSHLIFLYYFK